MSEIKIIGRGWEMRPIGEVIPYARNAKIHGEEQVASLRASLREFGFVRPLLIDGKGNLIAGHGILAAAKAEGMTEVPCVLADGMTDAQRRAYIHADNRLSELSTWDDKMLSLDLAELTDLGVDLEPLGFELEDLRLEEQEEDEALDLDGDDAPAQEKPETVTMHCPKCGFLFEVRA